MNKINLLAGVGLLSCITIIFAAPVLVSTPSGNYPNNVIPDTGVNNTSRSVVLPMRPQIQQKISQLFDGARYQSFHHYSKLHLFDIPASS